MTLSAKEIKSQMRQEKDTGNLSIALKYLEMLVNAEMDYPDAFHIVTDHFTEVHYDELQEAYDI